MILAVVLVENCDLKFDAAPVFLEVRGTVKNQNTLIMNEINEIPEDEKEPFGKNFIFKQFWYYFFK